MKTPKVILAAVVALAASLALVACGSSTAKVPQPTRLSFGQSMKVSSSLELKVTGVKEVPVKTLARFGVKRGEKPYFVDVTVTNIGKTDLGGTAIPLYLQDAHNALQAFAPMGNKFPACPSKVLPKSFGPNSSINTCLIYVLGQGNSATLVSYRPDMTKPAITWSGPIVGQAAIPTAKATH